MNIAVVGTGYVGLVTGTCLAETGNNVICVDINEEKVNKMRAGEVPIYEPHLDVLFHRNIKAGRLKFTTNLNEAIEKANNTPFGLSAGIWTEKGSRILEVAHRLRAGVIWANTFNKFDPTSPFGGYKESGYGREGGRHGLEPYLKAGK